MRQQPSARWSDSAARSNTCPPNAAAPVMSSPGAPVDEHRLEGWRTAPIRTPSQFDAPRPVQSHARQSAWPPAAGRRDHLVRPAGRPSIEPAGPAPRRRRRGGRAQRRRARDRDPPERRRAADQFAALRNRRPGGTMAAAEAVAGPAAASVTATLLEAETEPACDGAQSRAMATAAHSMARECDGSASSARDGDASTRRAMATAARPAQAIGQNFRLEDAQRQFRVNPELLGESVPRPVAMRRVHPPAGGSGRARAPAAASVLAQRLLSATRASRAGTSTALLPASSEAGREQLLTPERPQSRKSDRLGLGPRFFGVLDEGRPTPQGQRIGEGSYRLGRIPGSTLVPSISRSKRHASTASSATRRRYPGPSLAITLSRALAPRSGSSRRRRSPRCGLQRSCSSWAATARPRASRPIARRDDITPAIKQQCQDRAGAALSAAEVKRLAPRW